MTGRRIVCSRIIGGLGNQMFQYAAGLSLARRLDAELLLDLSGFASYQLRSYALQSFPIECAAIEQEPSRLLKVQGGLMRRLLGRSRLPDWGPVSFVKEPHFHFWPGFDEISASCHLDGYWQSPLYFRHVADELRQVFGLQRFSGPGTLGLEKAIADSPDAVALHVRRGDYVSNPEFFRVHGVCPQRYYDHAWSLLKRAFPAARCFIFSDSIDVVRNEFAHWNDATFVSGNTQEEDMMLMSKCRHLVLANSSYSWWAAWLRERADGLVIAPRYWFSREKMLTTSTVDLYPEEWVLL